MLASYDGSSIDISQQLLNLELELKEGDITQKGYNKKKNQLLEAYELSKNTIPESQPIPAMEINTPQKPNEEPSAADVKDFLDFLPSPTHSPTKSTKGADYMEQFYEQQQQQQQRKISKMIDNKVLTLEDPKIAYANRRQTQQLHHIYASKSGPPTPKNMLSMKDIRSPSLDPKPDIAHYNQPLDPEVWKFDASSRQSSVKSAPSRISQTHSNASSDNYHVRRKRSTQLIGRSRYRESYMATSFKAIEPAPQTHDHLDRLLLLDLAGRQMSPLKGPSILDNTDFKNLGEVLRFRSATSSNSTAFIVLDEKGRESSTISWKKLNERAQRIANELITKKGDCVGLIYRKSEVLEFIVSFFGCFLAGVVAIPINMAEDISEISFILTLTNINLILTTNYNHRAFLKDMKSISQTVQWWKTDEMKEVELDYLDIVVPELAYIEYTKAGNGELKGVTVSHVSVMEQCIAFQAATTTRKEEREIVTSSYEPRQQIGLILSVLFPIFIGNTVVFMPGSITDTPPLWIHLLSKYKATVALTDYPSMKLITTYFEQNPNDVLTYSKKTTPDLSGLRQIFIDTHVVQPNLNDTIAETLLRPLGNNDDPLKVVCPILSLPEYGGKIISIHDMKEEDHGIQAPSSRDVLQCLFETQALKSNKVLVLAVGNEAIKGANSNQGTLVEAFGFCMPNVTVAIVDPDTTTLCPPDTLGEVWINSPFINHDGFFALPQHTEAIFHARPITVGSDFYPEYYKEGTFLRTGLCGTTIGGRLFIMGSYEERIRQKQQLRLEKEDIFFSNEIVSTINKRAQVYECAVFEILVKDQHLPVVICESSIEDTSELSIKTTQVDDALIELHGFRAYCIAFVKPDTLPRVFLHGRRSCIHTLLLKRHFLQGRLFITYIKMNVDYTIFNAAANEDLVFNSIWRSNLAYERALRLAVITPHAQKQQQHTGIESVKTVLDERRSDVDLTNRFTNAVDILQWRASLYPEETAFVLQLDQINHGKTFTWRKMSYKTASVASHLLKKGVKRGNKVLVSIPFGMDYFFVIYGCLVIGAVPVPVEPPDPKHQSRRVTEYVQLLIDASRDLSASYIITNSATEDIFRSAKAMFKNLLNTNEKLPEMINVSKASRNRKMLGKESRIMMQSAFNSSPAVILIHHSTEGHRYYVYMGHDTLMNQCRTQKTTCQMRYHRSIVASGFGAYEGLGFLQALFCGIYVGCTTIYLPLQEFYTNPALLFECFQRYKVKDTFITNALIQYSMNRMHAQDTHQISLKGLQNMMLATDGRPKPLLYHHIIRYFARYRLEKEAINTIYTNVGNPMVTTRSYMLIEPIILSLDPYWLKYGIISTLPPEEEPYGVLLHDSGIVPSNTSIAIVNPETHTLCPSHMMGEIWVMSDSNAQMLYSKDDPSSIQRFGATIAGADPSVKYMRTGDYGFLWSIQRKKQDQPMLERGQCLYVLGSASETLVKDGLVYFPFDVEISIERCHPTIPSGGSVVFQSLNETVAVVSVKAVEYAMSIVPLIVSAILERHHFLIDTVVIVHPTTLTRSRFGEKMRQKAMKAYADSKLSSIYMKRITNQQENMTLPQWSQSQYSNEDTRSIISRSAQFLYEYNKMEEDFSFQLSRADTHRSRYSNLPTPTSSNQSEPMYH